MQANNHNLAIKTNGSVWGWGLNTSYQLGDGTITNRVAPFQISGVTGIQNATAGLSFSFVQDGTTSTWGFGNNSDGMLGDGTYIQKTIPSALFNCTGLNVTENNLFEQELPLLEIIDSVQKRSHSRLIQPPNRISFLPNKKSKV